MSDFNNYSHDSGNDYQYNGGYGGYNGSSYNNGGMNNNGSMNNNGGSKNKKPKKNHGSHWAKVVASALVFGLIAGTTTYAVNATADRISPAVTASASADSSSDASSSSSSSSSSDTGKTKSSADLTSSGDSKTSTTTETADTDGDGNLTVSEVAKNAMPAMVTISTMSVQEMQSFFGGSQEYQVEGAGSGVILEINDDEVLIATNNHVIDGADQVSVGFCDDSAYEATVKAADEDSDLAVVAVKTSDISDDTMKEIKAITIGDSDDLALGDQVVAIGNALGYGESVTSGYISAFDRSLELSDGTNTYQQEGLIQTDAAINPGNSGGALLNMKGELIGINEAKSSSTSTGETVDNMGYAIPLSKAQPILENLMNQETREKYSDSERGYLGVTTTDVTDDYAQLYGIPEGVGITAVADGSAAQKAGLQRGDIITKIGDKKVTSAEDLISELEYYAAGDQVTITYQRSGDSGSYEEKTATVTLESESDAQAGTGSSDNSGFGSSKDSGDGSLYQQIIGSDASRAD
ncbi:MAG: trypsin-like peptidase domain-containing protein [Eubacteriales bacterium]